MLVEVVLLGLLLYLLWQAFKKPENYPPGRWGLPLVGYLPLPGPKLADHYKLLHEQHGDVYMWRIGTQVMVFVHDYRIVKEAFSKLEFSNRPSWEIFLFLEESGKGVVSSNDALWHNNRRFSLRQLRDLGMGKSKLVEAIQRQAEFVAEVLAGQSGKAVPVPYALRVGIVNVIWQLVAGKQFDMDDPKLHEFERNMEEILRAGNRVSFKDFFPWLKTVLPTVLFDRLIKKADMRQAKDSFEKYFLAEIEEHRATLNPGEPRDLIDGYLLEMDQRKDDPNTTCSIRDLIILVMDLFFAGNETTTSTITWAIYYLATYPHVQDKMQAEIDAVLGTRQATMDDKLKLPYTEAVIHEALRVSSLTPLNLMHMAAKDTTLAGYTIPKGAIVNAVASSIHHDPRYWDKPDGFLPERWLDEEGKFVPKKEGFLPFGVGKRQCMGESLARMELFIFLTTILKRVNLSIPKGKTLDLRPDPKILVMHAVVRQDITATLRC